MDTSRLGKRVLAAGALAGFAVGWNITNVGAVAEPLREQYAVGLVVVGLFTTALFLVHALVQVPGGRGADRRGARGVAVAGLAAVAAGNGLALAAPDPYLACAARALAGLGTGAAFVAGSDYVRARGGGSVAQGVFGGSALAGGGVALALVPLLYEPLGWRAPFGSALALAVLAALALLGAPSAPPPAMPRRRPGLRELGGDARLRRLSVAHMASLGLSAVVANWAVTLLVRAGDLSLRQAGAISALTLAAGVVGRPLGGLLVRGRTARERTVVSVSLAAGAGATLLFLPAEPALAFAAATLVGVGAGLAFSPVFGAAARERSDAPGAAVGFVNMAGNLVIVAGAPLVGLTFAWPGEGRIGFAAVAALWAAALLYLPALPKPVGGESR